MSTDSRAGSPATAADLVDVEALVRAYHERHPDPGEPGSSASPSAPRATAARRSRPRSTTTTSPPPRQAIVEYRAAQGIDGPLFIGADTHALSEPGRLTALEVLVGERRDACSSTPRDGYTPTPAVSHAILAYNHEPQPPASPTASWSRRRTTRRRTAASSTTRRTAAPPTPTRPSGSPDRANELLAAKLDGVQRAATPTPARRRCGSTTSSAHYVDDLPAVIDLDAIRDAGVRIGADPLGGASVAYWGEIAERYGLDLTVVNPNVDPSSAFMTLDWDGKIRMDCSSPYAMASLRRAARRLRRSPRATTPTPTGTASSPPTAA